MYNDVNGAKVCKTCGLPRPLSSFKTRYNKHYKKRYTMNTCNHCIYKAGKAANDRWRKATLSAWYSKLSALGIDLSCPLCGYSGNPIGLDFHHSNGKASDKELIKSYAMRRTPTPERVNKLVEQLNSGELVILCAICHRIEHSHL